jgi:glutamate--cysteine ligase
VTSGIDRRYEARLAGLVNAREPRVLQGGLKGLEKESLRVNPDGRIAQTMHPRALGSALTNEHITTDYSESLIELVTPAFTESWALMQFLCDLHQFVYRHLGDELLWATSMPCILGGDDSIPIAQYGRSNVGMMKTVYRRGLGYRYGRMMQAISGVHFNYSFPQHLWPVLAEITETRAVDAEFVSARYFDLLRNYRRYGWLVLYLFGNSPALCPSFLDGRPHMLAVRPDGTLYEPCATSLRMSDLGYRNRSQEGVEVSMNSLGEYVRDLTRAITTPHAEYERIGVKVDGEYRQLNANLLQIENEYYSFIRPKRVARSGERPTHALLRGGVQYVEVRALDVSAFDPVGVNQNTLRFMETFLALCLLRDSPPIDRGEQAALDGNHVTVAHQGRTPALDLVRDGRRVPLVGWALELIDAMRGPAELLDNGDAARPYTAALEVQEAKVRDVSLTPSALSLRELEENHESFSGYALRMSREHKAYSMELYPPDEARLAEFRDEAAASLERQAGIEAVDKLSFDAYLERYFAS